MADFEKKQPVLDRRHFVGGALAASALAALAGCTKGGTTTGGSAATGGAQGGTLRYYINNPVCIEPYNLQEDQGTQVGFQLFDSLTQYNFETGELEPLACETTTPLSSPSTSRRPSSTTAPTSSLPTGSMAGSAS